jgi:hypothetical protein
MPPVLQTGSFATRINCPERRVRNMVDSSLWWVPVEAIGPVSRTQVAP